MRSPSRALSLPYELCEALELRAELLLRQEHCADALTACAEARELAERIGEHDVTERTRVLALRLCAAMGELTADAACAALGALLETATEELARAALLMAIWQISPQRLDIRTAAATIYHQRYAAAPSAELGRHYRSLTGEDLPQPAPLPPLLEALMGTPVPLGDLLARAGVE